MVDALRNFRRTMKKARMAVKQLIYNRALRLFPGHIPADSFQLLYEARRQTGCMETGDPLFMEAYRRLHTSIMTEARLHAEGRRAVRRMLDGLLINRLCLEHARRQTPAISEERIEKPIFILGMPRTGSTLLQRLLCSIPALRGLRLEQMIMPAPLPHQDAAAFARERIRWVNEYLRHIRRCAPELDQLHHVSAGTVDECYQLLRNSFMHTSFHYLGPLPSYMQWLAAQDGGSSYQDYLFQLQLLQHQEPGGRWVLKSPSHWNTLAAWRATFPDAYVIQTHREMDEVLPSLESLLIASKKLYTNDRVDYEKRRPFLRDFMLKR